MKIHKIWMSRYINAMKERVYSSLMGFLCTPRFYFLLKCLNALDERCNISRSLFQRNVSRWLMHFQHSWILLYSTNISPICTINFFNGFIVSRIVSFIEHTYNTLLNRYVQLNCLDQTTIHNKWTHVHA